jgi:predicted dehydrogenase
MRFALLGNHPDGLEFAAALAGTGRHELAVYSGPGAGLDALRRRGVETRSVGDLEEILADPAVEAVIVAGSIADRPTQLRRALQSERDVICVHPADQTADVAYEAAMIRDDTGHRLMPLMPETLHPGVGRLRELLAGALGAARLIELERWSTHEVLIDTDPAKHRPSLPGWDLLRALGGEVAEVSAFAAGEEAEAAAPLVLNGRFEGGILFRSTFLPKQGEERWRLSVVGSHGRADLVFLQGWPGPARLTWSGLAGEVQQEDWPTWNLWAALVEAFEAPSGPSRPTWQDEVRCLELDAAARRSVHYRRVSVMEYQEASEEVGFKGTMTLVGCGLLWGILFFLILSVWVPTLGWLIVPLLVIFLILQMLRWIIPGRKSPGGDEPGA